LSCPACGALVHAEELKRLAALAQQSSPSEALAHWRKAIGLLPRDSEQFKQVAAKIETISRSLETMPGAVSKAKSGKWKGAAASGGVLLVMLAKFKTAIFLLLGGFAKFGMLASMFFSMGVYWTAFGWPLAVGLILCIYVHEMGHIAALKRLGIAATAPMFIPGFGALILLKQNYFSPREDARHGLAGPRWGLGASIFTALLGFAIHSPVCLVIAQWNAWINLFNLLPVWSLDGARGFHALRRRDRIVAALVFIASSLPLFSRGHLGKMAVVAAVVGSVYGVIRQEEPETTDPRAFWEYIGLCVVLTAFSWLPVSV